MVLMMTVCARAQTVLFDFGNDASFRGLSVQNPDTNGNYWNSFRTGVFYQNLIDIHNVPTTIDFGFSTPVATDSYNGPAGATSTLTLTTDVEFAEYNAAALGLIGGSNRAVFDYVAGPSLADNRVRFEIQELDPTKRYKLTFFGSHKFSTDNTTNYKVYSDNTYSTVVGSTSLNVQTPGSPNLHNQDTVATISNLAPQASNILYVEFVGANGAEGYLNDMILEAVAAPGINGDYNANGVVDAADYVVWRDNSGTTNVLPNDPTGGTIGSNQYNTWRGNFGLTAGAGSGVGTGGAVPEPTSLAFGLCALLGISVLGRWR
jgi:hypothetical protein